MLEKGSTSNPTGNLIVYCKVIGENPFQSGCDIIASNVVVSFLKVNESLPVVTFPPVSYPAMEDLQKALAKNIDTYDIAKLPDFIMPEDTERGNRYLQERMEQYNSFVLRYVELCKNKDKGEMKYIPADDLNQSMNILMEASLQYRNSDGLAREMAKHKIENLTSEISVKNPEFDLENYKNAIYTYQGPMGDELASLYVKKFKAIRFEEYEEASQLKRKILDLEANIH
jgi:hypothetical protein